MYHNLFDSHTHSENSPDAVHSVVFMAEYALRNGLHGLAITDHCDCEMLEEEHFEQRIRHAAVDVAKARAAFRHRLVLTLGIELGQPLLNPTGAQRMLEALPYDVVLGAQHRVRGEEEFYSMDFSRYSPAELHNLLLAYWEHLAELIAWGGFDVLAHLDIPMRYLRLNSGISVDTRRYADVLDSILRLLVETGKGLEINTSGLHNAMERTMPEQWVLHRYRELGGELVTIGSDAHSAYDVGRGVEHGLRLLEQAGYEYFTFYRRRRPVMLRII